MNKGKEERQQPFLFVVIANRRIYERFVNRPYLGIVMVKVISCSVSRRSEMAEIPERWMRCKDC